MLGLVVFRRVVERMRKLSKLFQPIRIRTMELKNRIVMPAMHTLFAGETGAVTQRLIDYYAERAKGGVALIIVEATYIDRSATSRVGHLYIDDNKFISGLNDLAEAVQVYGAKIAVQLTHAGRLAALLEDKGRQPVSASDVHRPETPWGHGSNARGLTIGEVEHLVEAFAKGAQRAKAAGFDAVEFHGGHGMLIAQFLSPYTNMRTDKYGRDFDGRLRFALEIIERTREKVGPNFPLIFRVSGDEYVKGGLTLEDTKAIAQKLEEATIDVLHVSAGLFESRPWTIPPMCVPRGCQVHLAEGVKRAVSVPVITVSRINDPTLAEEILQQNKADLVSMGRALIADPELPRKAFEGRLHDIRKCLACMYGCYMRRHLRGWRMSCDINAMVGKEREYRITPAEKPKSIVIVGGGPAGMEAARVAALRGHEVTLLEKSDRLGGQLILASASPYKEEIKNIAEYLLYQITQLGVRIKLREEGTLAVIREAKPDVVIVATGATPFVPEVPGVKRKNVILAWDLLAGKSKAEGKKVVVAGGGSVGCEAAEYLAREGKEVTLVEMLEEAAPDVDPFSKWFLIERFKKHGIKILTGAKIEEIADKAVSIVDGKHNRRTLETDSVVLALGSTSNKDLIEIMKRESQEFYAIGDCVEPRRIFDAIHEGCACVLKRIA